MSLPSQSSKGLEAAETLATAFRQAGRESIASGEPVGWLAGQRRYRFDRYRRGAWERLSDETTLIGGGNASDHINMRVLDKDSGGVEDQVENGTSGLDQLYLVFSPTGETTAVAVEFMDGRDRYVVGVDEAGRVSVAIENGSAS